MMTEQEQIERKRQLTHGIDEDGTVDGYLVETYAAPIHAMIAPAQYGYEVNRENRFVAFTVDNGETDLEVRLPFELIEQMQKWIAEAPDAAMVK